MKRSLLTYLRCPESGAPLKLYPTQEDAVSSEILEGILRTDCGHEYTIKEGVPVMLSSLSQDPDQQLTTSSFSEKWKLAPNYREKTKPHYIQWYLDRYGFGNLDALQKFLSNKQFILDAGTGEGRDTELYSQNSSALVFGVDMSEGIHYAYRDLNHLPNVHLIQADLTKLPFPKNFFDFIACDQVIHHTRDTYQSLRCLLQHLNSGHIAIYTYKKKAPIREFCDDMIRSHTVKYSVEECMKTSEAFTKLGKALADLKVTIDVPDDIPLLGLKAGKHDLQRWIYWNFFKCYWNDQIDFDSNVITNFDWYHPLYAHRHTAKEVRSWFKSEGITIDHFSEVESGISVLGSKHAQDKH